MQLIALENKLDVSKFKKPSHGGSPDAKLNAFFNKVNNSYKGSVIKLGSKIGRLNIPRFSSGSISLDLALGGGWPFSRIIVIAGEYSTGKTLLALRAMTEVEKYDHFTKKRIDSLDEDASYVPGRALFVDAEGAFDIEWAKINGFNDEYHAVAIPEYAEQAIDTVTMAIDENLFDLIIIDSLAALTPAKEIEESMEDWQMGLAARLLNKAFRKWQASLNKQSQNVEGGGATLVCLNQFRINIGQFFGDPRTLPGGKGQQFASSIIVYMKTGEYDDTKTKELSEVNLRGVVQKNKTYIPKQNFEFGFSLKRSGDVEKGTINNSKDLVKYGKKHKLLVKKGMGYKFGDKEFRNEAEVLQRLRTSENLRSLMWKSILAAAQK